MSYYLLCSDVCSLGHCVASWTSTLPGSICDVAVRHSHIRIVARSFGTWATAFHVLHPVLLHAHDGLVAFPCLWRRGSFPHTLPFYATGTASTLTALWSWWSLVTSVPVAVVFGIWLDWPTPTTLHVDSNPDRPARSHSLYRLRYLTHSASVECEKCPEC